MGIIYFKYYLEQFHVICVHTHTHTRLLTTIQDARYECTIVKTIKKIGLHLSQFEETAENGEAAMCDHTASEKSGLLLLDSI